jgi:hypothetical protein
MGSARPGKRRRLSSSRACRPSPPIASRRASSRARASPGSDSASRTATRPSLPGPTTFAWRAKRNGPRNRSASGFVFRISPFGGCGSRKMSTTARWEPGSPPGANAREPSPEAGGSRPVLHRWRSQYSGRLRQIVATPRSPFLQHGQLGFVEWPQLKCNLYVPGTPRSRPPPGGTHRVSGRTTL